MNRPPSFDLISGLRCTSHGVIALALAGEFDPDVDVDAVQDALVSLSDGLRETARVRDENQLALVGDVLAHELAVVSARCAAEEGVMARSSGISAEVMMLSLRCVRGSGARERHTFHASSAVTTSSV